MMMMTEKNQDEQQQVVESNENMINKEQIPLMALNHIARLCTSVKASIQFYNQVLRIVLINRPPSLHFNGVWLFNYGVGIHLVQKKENIPNLEATNDRLDPMDNHISFQRQDMGVIEKRLKEMNIKYLKRTINEEGSPIDKLFFNDPDGFMIEICNCENLELVPAGSLVNIRLPKDLHKPPLQISHEGVHHEHEN